VWFAFLKGQKIQTLLPSKLPLVFLVGSVAPTSFSFVVLVVDFTRESTEDFVGFIIVGDRNYSI
jgi:hypothetical protein